MIGASALKARQKRVMDVDDWTGRVLAQVFRENLHVSGQYRQLNLSAAHKSQKFFFDGRFVDVRCVQMLKRYAVFLGETRGITQMVGSNTDNVHLQLTGAVPVQQVGEAVGPAKQAASIRVLVESL